MILAAITLLLLLSLAPGTKADTDLLISENGGGILVKWCGRVNTAVLPEDSYSVSTRPYVNRTGFVGLSDTLVLALGGSTEADLYTIVDAGVSVSTLGPPLLVGGTNNVEPGVDGSTAGGPLGFDRTDAQKPIIYLPKNYPSDSAFQGFTRLKGQSFAESGINDGVTWTLTISGVGSVPQVLTFRTDKDAVSACTHPDNPPTILQNIIDFFLVIPRFFLDFISGLLGLVFGG